MKEKQIYVLEKDDISYHLPNQKLPFLKKDFYVKNSYADLIINDTEISISIYDGSEFNMQLNHYRGIEGMIDKEGEFLAEENSLNEKEKIFYEENKEIIERTMRELLSIHMSVYSK